MATGTAVEVNIVFLEVGRDFCPRPSAAGSHFGHFETRGAIKHRFEYFSSFMSLSDIDRILDEAAVLLEESDVSRVTSKSGMG